MTNLHGINTEATGRSVCGAARLLSSPTKQMFLALLVLFLVFGSTTSVAQEDIHFKAANTSSPRDTLRSFIEACNELHDIISTDRYFDSSDPKHLAIIRQALDCIDDSELAAFARRDRAGEVAACLKEILDRVELPPWEEIPDTADILAKGGSKNLDHYRIPDTRITIAAVDQGSKRHEYLFSPGTADRAVEYFRGIQSKPYRSEGNGPPISENLYRWYISSPGHPALAAIVRRLPDFLQFKQTWGLTNWKWVGLFVTLFVALAFMVVAFRAYTYFANRTGEKSLFLYWLTIGFPVVAMFIPLVVKHFSYRYLSLRSTPLYIIDFTSILMALLASLVVISAASDRIAATVIASPQINPNGLNAQLIRIIAQFISLVAAVVLFLVGGQYLGIPFATLLTSAGIGGVAIALGAQGTLKTLFGTISLLSDKPFRVGERIVFAKYDGVVEDLGLRSTKLRLLNGHQVTLPNDRLAENDIENVGRRKYIRRVGEIHIPLDSSFEKIQQAVAIVRQELKDHEGMEPDHPPRVFLDDFISGAFRIKFYYWYTPADFWKSQAFGEKLNFAVIRRFEEEAVKWLA
jgi:MscS family membrane protein